MPSRKVHAARRSLFAHPVRDQAGSIPESPTKFCGIGRYGYALGLSSKGFAFTRYALAVRSRATALTAGSPGDSNQSFAGLADMDMHSPFKRDEAGSIPASRTSGSL